MANQKLEDMTAASTLDGTELLYTVQGGQDRKATVAQILPPPTAPGQVVYCLADGLGVLYWELLDMPPDDGSDYFLFAQAGSNPVWATVPIPPLSDLLPFNAPGDIAYVHPPIGMGVAYWDVLPIGNEGDVLTVVDGLPAWVAP